MRVADLPGQAGIMRLAAVVCVLHFTTARQEDLLLLREDQCDDALFVAHWTQGPEMSRSGLNQARC